jgi:hypothetical protein
MIHGSSCKRPYWLSQSGSLHNPDRCGTCHFQPAQWRTGQSVRIRFLAIPHDVRAIFCADFSPLQFIASSIDSAPPQKVTVGERPSEHLAPLLASQGSTFQSFDIRSLQPRSALSLRFSVLIFAALHFALLLRTTAALHGCSFQSVQKLLLPFLHNFAAIVGIVMLCISSRHFNEPQPRPSPGGNFRGVLLFTPAESGLTRWLGIY